MTQDEMVYIRSGGRRIELYAELGGYFSSDGRLKQAELRAFLRESLSAEGAEASQWLSSYLEGVLTYLEGKGMADVTLELFEVAVDEAANVGIREVALGPARMRRLLALAAVKENASGAKTTHPDNKEKQIFEAALNVFAERGYHDATMDEIAAACNVAKGTLYRHFKSKEDLLDRLLVETSKDVVGRLSSIFSGGRSVLEEIQDFIEQWVAFIEQNHVLYRLIQTEGIVVPRSGKRTMFYEYLIANLPMLKEHMAAMNQERTLKLTSFYTVAYGMLGFIDGVVHRWFRSGMDYPLRDEIPVILEVLFNGFVGERGDGKSFFVAPEDQ